jgi:hypothetical protein
MKEKEILNKLLNEPIDWASLIKKSIKESKADWTEQSSDEFESWLKLQKCLSEGYTYEDFVKYGEIFCKNK